VNKQKAAKICRGAARVLAVAFVVMLGLDWLHYNTTLNSAPFWVTAAVDGICLLLPAFALLLAAHILGKK